MAQISIFDKTRHYSEKDFTCSIGKKDIVYFTFRNNSWERFTESDSIAVYVKASKKGNYLRFGDPEKGAPGAVFKLGYKKDKHESREHTRYLQINGKNYPEILEIVRSKSGSYDFGPDSVHAPKAKRQRKAKKPTTTEQIEDLKKAVEVAKVISTAHRGLMANTEEELKHISPIERKSPEVVITELNARVSSLETMLGQLEERVRTLETKSPQAAAPYVDTSRGPDDWKKALIETINSL